MASEDIETQRNGYVFIVIHNPDICEVTTKKKSSTKGNNSEDTRAFPDIKWGRILAKWRESIPLRLVACHVCTPDSPYYRMIRSWQTFLCPPHLRCRLKFHKGQDTENLY